MMDFFREQITLKAFVGTVVTFALIITVLSLVELI